MGKFRLRAHLDQALLLLLIMAGALMTAVLEVRGALEVSGAGKSRHATAVAAPRAAARGAGGGGISNALRECRHAAGAPVVPSVRAPAHVTVNSRCPLAAHDRRTWASPGVAFGRFNEVLDDA